MVLFANRVKEPDVDEFGLSASISDVMLSANEMMCLQYILKWQYVIYVLVQENVRENRRGNQEWNNHRHSQHWAQETEGRQQKT